APSVTGIGRDAPRRDVSSAEAAELVDELPIPVPAAPRAPQAGAEGVAPLARRALLEGAAIVLVSEIIEIDGRFGRQPAGLGIDGVEAPQRLSVVGTVVETARLDLYRANGECIDAPVAERQPSAAAVELAPHVRPLAHVDQTRRAVAQFLPAEPQRGVRDRPQRRGQVGNPCCRSRRVGGLFLFVAHQAQASSSGSPRANASRLMMSSWAVNRPA